LALLQNSRLIGPLAGTPFSTPLLSQHRIAILRTRGVNITRPANLGRIVNGATSRTFPGHARFTYVRLSGHIDISTIDGRYYTGARQSTARFHLSVDDRCPRIDGPLKRNN